MSRYKGYVPTVSNTEAIGIWDLRQQELYKKDGVWVLPPPPIGSERYVRWNITQSRSASTMIQVSELVFLNSGTPISWTGVTITNPSGSNPSNETPDKLIDGNNSTKWLDFNFSSNGFSNILLDWGAGNVFPAFDSYYYVTGNDSAERDPVSWVLEISNDLTNWTTLDTVTSATITTSRNTATQTFVL